MQLGTPLALFLANNPGSFARVCEALTGAKINLEYACCATSPNARNGRLVLRASDCKKALKVFNA